ncbi:hypothetical protein B0H21DRAFT_776336 [Amylocystis lapponica]|nr:hypothetical protein B0H21DRAFT_776336 [Amylocystis lapponica]
MSLMLHCTSEFQGAEGLGACLRRPAARLRPQTHPSCLLPSARTYLYNQSHQALPVQRILPPHLLPAHRLHPHPRLIHLRRDIAAAATGTPSPPSLSSPTPIPPPAQLPTLTVLRTSLFGVAPARLRPLDAAATSAIASLVTGGLAVLSFPTLDPPQLNAVLRALARATPAQLAQAAKDAEAAFVPGRRAKRVRARHPPELRVVGALVEGRVFAAERVQDVAGLPTLDVLRAQLVGLLSAPAAQLAMLARTLEGFKKSLEEGEGAQAEGP